MRKMFSKRGREIYKYKLTSFPSLFEIPHLMYFQKHNLKALIKIFNAY